MFSVDDLKNITQTPNEEDISLQLYAEFYDKYISNRIYELQMEDGGVLMFLAENRHFPHLIGLHKFWDRSNENYLLHRINQLKKDNGFKNLKDGLIKISDLRTVGKKSSVYKNYKKRILNFPFTYQMLRKSRFLTYNKDLVEPKTKINGDYLFVKNIDNNKLHFFFINSTNIEDLIKEGDNEEDSTVPITFVVEKISDTTFTERQASFKIKKIVIKNSSSFEILEEIEFIEEVEDFSKIEIKEIIRDNVNIEQMPKEEVGA